jgi:cell division septation protein DedD
MSYYDFANQQRKTSKPKQYGLYALILIAVIAAMLLLTSHHSKKPVVAANHAVSVKLPAATTRLQLPVAKTTTQLSQKATAPKLEFYQLLKSSKQRTTMPKHAALHSQYTLQVAALASPAAAQQLVHRLQKQAFSAHIISTENGGSTHWNRVLVGPYKTQDAAKAVQQKLRKIGQRGVLLISKP